MSYPGIICRQHAEPSDPLSRDRDGLAASKGGWPFPGGVRGVAKPGIWAPAERPG
jgi:hypothetical protein